MSEAYPFDERALKDGIIFSDKYNGLPDKISCSQGKEIVQDEKTFKIEGVLVHKNTSKMKIFSGITL